MLKFVNDHPKYHRYWQKKFIDQGYEYRGFVKSMNGWYMVFYHLKYNLTKPK